MHVYAEVVSWIWVVLVVPICGYFLLFDWRLDEVQITKTERVIHASLQKCRPITAEIVVVNVSIGRR